MKVLLLVAHGLNTGYVGCYGNEWVSTPLLDQLAVEGIVFDQHYADHADANCPCQFSLSEFNHLPGPAPPQPTHDLFGDPKIVTVLLRTSNLTASVEASHWTRSETIDVVDDAEENLNNLANGICDILNDVRRKSHCLVRVDIGSLVPPWNPLPSIQEEYSRIEMGDDSEGEEPADSEQESAGTTPIPEEGISENQIQYASAVTSLDQCLKLLFEDKRTRKILDEMLIVVTSFRGQDTGEITSFRKWAVPLLHEELVHVPLIVRMPEGANAGRRVSALTQPLELVPTLLDALGLSARELRGHSLLPLMEGKTESIHEYAFSWARIGEANSWAIRTKDWCLLRADSPDSLKSYLFKKPEDRWEVNDVFALYPEIVEGLEAPMKQFVAAIRR
jgi:arylsulfatase A-like enzyme